MSFAITILGCGSSGGVPRVGNDWGACDSSNPKNRRRRCSILVERFNGEHRTVALVDTSPDLREQLLDADTRQLDAILVTHSHADHVHGIDDVRPLVIKMRRRIGMHMDEATAKILATRFAYVFETQPGSQYPPLLDDCRIATGVDFGIEGPGGRIDCLPIRFEHGEMDALGFRFGNVAYTPDLKSVPPESLDALQGLDVWIIDALRYTRHPSHLSVEEALDLIRQLKPRRAILTNLHTDLDFARLEAELPAGVEPAFDGLKLRF